jgi:hypothetical protein
MRWGGVLRGLSVPRRSGCCVAGSKGHHHPRTIGAELGNWQQVRPRFPEIALPALILGYCGLLSK